MKLSLFNYHITNFAYVHIGGLSLDAKVPYVDGHAYEV